MNVASPLTKGKRAFVRYREERKEVTILEICDDTVTVTVPDGSLPVKNLGVSLEIPTLEGTYCYHTHVATAPRDDDDILLLRRTASVKRFDRRRTWRVPLHARTKASQLDGRRVFRAVVVDVSAEGVLLFSAGPFEPGELITFQLYIPNELPHEICARVVRVKETVRDGQTVYTLGAAYHELSKPARRALTYYIWKRLLELFPTEVRGLFRRGSQSQIDRRLKLIGSPDEEYPADTDGAGVSGDTSDGQVEYS